MKRNVSLYIAGTKVDLDDASLILFNYTKDDLSNPTAVKNSYSHNVTLKGTPTNNKLFGDIFRLDRQTLYSGKYNGAYFDPMRKTPFQIYDETSAVLESGYVKLESVSRNGNDISYSITLYGGLGSFFYGLTYNEDGSKKTLADMVYKTLNGTWAEKFGIFTDATTVQEAWSYLEDPDSFNVDQADFRCWNVINFAPCYNGLPENFDANKALIRGTEWFINGIASKTVDGVTYGTKAGANSTLVTFTNPHTEWEVGDLRWYLQRPIISVASIIEAISYSANNGGYTVQLDPTFFRKENAAYSQAWITMQMIGKDERDSRDCLESVFRATNSPAEYLLSYAKMNGLVFKYDNGTKTVSILSRNTFYQQSGNAVDLSERINKSQPIEIIPFTATSKWYQFGKNVIGQFAEEYKKDYNREYGIQKINTGYEFDTNVVDLTKDLIFKDAVEVMESNRMFIYREGRDLDGYKPFFMLPAFEQVTVQLWNGEETIDVNMQASIAQIRYDNLDHPYMDWLAKVQLHGPENKTIDGSNVMLLFNGVKYSPLNSKENRRKKYLITNDSADMTTLNGNACWNLTGDGVAIEKLPSFRRCVVIDDDITQSLEWGEPLARAVPDLGDLGRTVYEMWWKNYLTDLYDDDARIMKCKVNLSGLNVGQDLLRKFYWYGGSIWVLNKINNYSITTYDDAECEFIRVSDKDNYTNGQKEW